MERHPKTGAAQWVDIRERHQSIGWMRGLLGGHRQYGRCCGDDGNPFDRRQLATQNPIRWGWGFEAGEGVRTLDIHVGNVTLYH